MRDRFFIILTILVAILGTVLVTRYLLTPVVTTTLSAQVKDGIDTSTVTVPADGSPDSNLAVIVKIADPFSKEAPPALLLTSKDSNHPQVIAATFSKTDSDHLRLPESFESEGIFQDAMEDTSHLTSAHATVVAQYITFTKPGKVTWPDVPNTSRGNLWADHPNSLNVNAGQMVVISYTSSDAGNTWIGDVKLVSP